MGYTEMSLCLRKKFNEVNEVLCFVDRASLYNLVNKANLVHNLSSVYLFLVHLSLSICFGQLCFHHQEKQLCLCDTWCLFFCVDDWYVEWIDKCTKNKLCTKLTLFTGDKTTL